MDWICYVFTRGGCHYLVADESLDSAWEALARRQSCSLENCKKWYKFKGHMNANGGVWKLK